jgi:hypothetical protein
MGLLVVLRYSRIPFFVYYPRFTDTVLVSESLDMLLFVGASLCVPLSVLVFALQPGARRRALRNGGVILVVVLAVWLLSLVFMSRSPSLAVLTLFASTVSVAIVDVSASDSVYGLEWRLAVSEMLVPLMTIFALIEFSPIYYWILSAISPGTRIGEEAAEFELNLTYSLYPLAPFILVALISSWIWVPATLRLLRAKSSPTPTYKPAPTVGGVIEHRTLAASVDLIAILAIVVFYYPYFAGQLWLVGVDAYKNYYDPLVRLAGMKPSEALPLLFSTSLSLPPYHGAYVAILFLVNLTTELSPFLIVKFAPLLLTILTSIIIFWVFLESSREPRLALLISACSIFWIPTTLSIFGDLQANWTVLALWMIFIALMLRWMRRPSKGAIYFVLQAIVSLGILLIHPWTWGIFVATLIIQTFMLRLEKMPAARVSATTVLSSLVFAATVGAAGALYAPSMRKDMLDTVTIYLQTLFNPNSLTLIWGAISSVFTEWGSFLSPLLLVASLVGAVVVIQRNDSLSRYVLAWIVVWSVGSILAAPVGYYPSHPELSETQLWRMLYLSPLPILLAFGIRYIMQLSRRLDPMTSLSRHATTWTFFAVVGVVALLSAFIVAFPLPIMKLIAVVIALLLVCFLSRSVTPSRTASILIAIVLILIVMNGAFRSLYPLLLDPHNLHTM